MDTSHTNHASQIHHGGSDNTDDPYKLDFLEGIDSYANNGDTTNEVPYYHPELFQSQDFNHALQPQAQREQSQQQQHHNMYSNTTMNQLGSGRTQSPVMPAFSQPRQYAQHPQYSQQLYPQQNMYSHQAYDPRTYQQRPSSHSPAPMEQFGYPGQYASQGQHAMMNIQPRPGQVSTSQYQAQQSNYSPSPYTTFNNNPALPQRQDPDLMQFANFRSQNQNQTHGFVNPALLDGNSSAAHYSQLQQAQKQQQRQQQQQPPQQPSQAGLYYPKPGSAIPQAYSQQIMHQNQPQAMQQGQMQPQAGTPQQQNVFPQMAPMPQQATSTGPPMNAVMQPKRGRGRPRKDGKITKSNGGTVSSESDSELEIEDELPETEPALISVAPPTDPRSKAVYDAVQAVWSPRNKVAPTAKIKSGIVQFGEVIRAVRDQWKARNDSLKKAEADNSPTAADAPALRQETAQYRQTMETLVIRTATFGHPSILKSLGEIPYTLSALYSFLLDRVSAADYDNSLLLAILKLAAKFTTVDEEKLESSKYTKLLQRVSKKGSADTKGLADLIVANAKKQTAAKADAAKSEVKGELAAGMKRSREGEGLVPPPKKTVRPASKPLAVQNAEKRRAEMLAEAAKKAKPSNTSTTGGTLITPAAAKPKPPIKPTTSTPFSSLMSASKKPGTTNAERAAAKGKDGTTPAVQQAKQDLVMRDPPPVSTTQPAASNAASSFLTNLFSGMEKKEEPKPVEEEEVKGETPDEKAKRLRKESRRKLRVSWKNDSDLVQVKEFTHDPEEEIKQGDSAMKDAGDTGKEGEMLKRAQAMGDIDDEDDEEDEDPDFDPDCYSPPSEVDFSEIWSEDNEAAMNGVKYGGNLVAQSNAKEAQDKFEETVLMVFYSESDRPDAPKEPPEEGDDDFTPSADFGEPEERVRNKEKDVYSRRHAQAPRMDGAADFGSSGQPFGGVGLQQYFQQPAQPAQFNTAELLARFTGQQQPQQPQLVPTGNVDWTSILAGFSQNQNNTQAPPAPAPSATIQTPAINIDVKSILAQLQANNQAAQAAPAYGQSSATGDDYSYGNGANGGNGKNKGKKGKNPVPLDANGLPVNYKTRVCEFWEKGACSKGDACTFKHSR